MKSIKDKENNIYGILSSGLQSVKDMVLESGKISGIDAEYREFVAELFGKLFGKTVWLLAGDVNDDFGGYTVKVEDSFDISKLVDLGYERVERVWNMGEFSVLGDIVIVWPFSMNNLVRISLLDECIESISIVDVDSRKKIKDISIKIFPSSSSDLLVGNEDCDDSIRLRIVDGIGDNDSVCIGIRNIPGIETYASRKAVVEIVGNYKSRGYKVLYVTDNLDRYNESSDNTIADMIDSVCINDGCIRRGFVCNLSKVVVLTDLEVLGEIDLSSFQKRNISIDPSSVAILKKIVPGDYVVHEDHGIGKYVNVEKKDSGYYMEIAYAGRDRLFVPMSASDKLTKYIGAGKAKPILTGLNSGVWRRISEKAKERAEDIAEELLQLYAMREASTVVPVLQEDDVYELNDFVKGFVFEDTDDQIIATKNIVDDFRKGKPMDRLLVGDVGYGKTEIAMRAMFAVVNSGKQVAFLAPTTILVEQHLVALRERFKDYPFNIVSLSRFTTNRERSEIINGIKCGSVDIVVGTHALLSDDIEFMNLGLLVVDEEQKFGVKQKEKIKSKRLDCNVLSLTATPIPRTLNMSLIGIRDISVLATPPVGRKEIINSFGKFDWGSVEDAIKKELARGGQVYFLHNRVGTIESVYNKLVKLFPHSNIGIAHGQMGADVLLKTMSKFVSGDIDILICTTIIENGLDIQKANTLVVDDATMLGLSQMYQIRGRIGRSKVQAYAYFYYDSLKGDAKLRLEALKSSQELGSGFLLSNKDLEIRGAGDILGKNQSGAINSVGYGLYSQMLNDAVMRLKGVSK